MGCERGPSVTGPGPLRVVVVIVPLPPAAAAQGVPELAVRWVACGPLLLLVLFVAPSDAAWEVRLTPEVGAIAEYSDNVTSANQEAESLADLSLAVTPALGWSCDREDLRLDGRSGLRAERFLENNDLDGEEWHHRLGATWRLNERWTLAASEEWRQSRDVNDLIEAGEIVIRRQRLTTSDATTTLTWQPTERIRTDLAYTNYNSQSEDPANTDYLLHMVQGTASLQATEQLGLFAGANLQDYDFNPSPGDPARRRFFTRNYTAFAGAGYQLSERFDARLQIGARYTEQTTRGLALDATRFPIGFVELEETATSTNGTFSGSATYTLERGAITVNASQDLTATAGAEGTVERRSLGLSANHWFAPDWQWTAAATYTTHQTDTGLAATERDTRGLTTTAGLRHRLNDHWDATLTVRRTDFRDDALDTETERHAALLSLTGRWPQTL